MIGENTTEPDLSDEENFVVELGKAIDRTLEVAKPRIESDRSSMPMYLDDALILVAASRLWLAGRVSVQAAPTTPIHFRTGWDGSVEACGCPLTADHHVRDIMLPAPTLTTEEPPKHPETFEDVVKRYFPRDWMQVVEELRIADERSRPWGPATTA